MNKNDSNTIKICRVLCILFMTYVHVNPGKSQWNQEAPQYLQDMIYVLADILGHASVPALSLLGGYLAVSAFNRRASAWVYIKDRATTLLVPLMTWNVITILLSLLILIFTHKHTSVMREMMPIESISFASALDKLTGYDYGAAAPALNFLRDIFICSATLPLLILLFNRIGILCLAMIWIAGLSLGFDPIIIRYNIPLFFATGVYIALNSTQLIPSREILAKILATLLFSLAFVNFTPESIMGNPQNCSRTLLRIVVATGFLITAVLLSRTRIGHLIAQADPVAYLFFLSHTVLITLLWGAWQLVFGNALTQPYMFFYLLAPFTSLLLLLMAYRLLMKLPDIMQIILSGKIIKN